MLPVRTGKSVSLETFCWEAVNQVREELAEMSSSKGMARELCYPVVKVVMWHLQPTQFGFILGHHFET